MLLNTWLTAAKRLFQTSLPSAGNGRRSMKHRHQSHQAETLEPKSLLTALVINNENLDSFLATDGGLDITNATLGTHDSLVIEQITLSSTGDAISVNLTGIDLERIAIETVTIDAFSGEAIDINLTNVTNNRTIAIEDILINDANGGSGISVTLDNTDSHAITVEDSIAPTIAITATNGSDIGHGLVTENEVSAPANIEAVSLTVNGGSADDFHIVNNRQLQALNRDAVQVNLTNSPLDGLKIANNEIGNEPGADVLFRAVGDTFVQPFELTNNGIDGELLETFVMDLRPLGLVFDDGVNGQSFTVTAGSDVTGAETNAVLSQNNQVLTVTFTDFVPGETLLFVIDVDIAPESFPGAPIDTPIFGNDLIGTPVEFNFDAGNTGTQPKRVAGVMVGDAEIFNASVFARGAGAASNVHGINLNIDNSPLTNTEILDNIITGVAGHGLVFDATSESDISGEILRNTITSSGQDGIHFALEDSNFVGAVNQNSIAANSGHGINFQPSASRSGLVEEAFDGDPVIITSTNHQLQTGDEIIIQGMTNATANVNHPGNGRHTVRRLSNNTFELVGVNGLAAGVNYRAGGAWYVPDFVGGEAQGVVTIDVKATEAEGSVTAIENPAGGGDVEITSRAHGLTSGQRIRLSGATGTLLQGDFKVTVISDDVFSLDGENAVGAYDLSNGLATWRANLVTGASVAADGEVTLTSVGHGLKTGDQVRVAGIGGVAGANGTFTITRLSTDTFKLQGSSASVTDVYTPATGYWTPLAEATFTGDLLTQQVANNAITGNGQAGIFVNLLTGTTFDGDLLSNTIVSNAAKGIHIESHSYGVGETLPLPVGDPLAVPGAQDISFNVNIGSEITNTDPATGIPLDGNLIDLNGEAGIVIEVLDLATGSFEIQGNRIIRNQDDNDATTAWAGDGIFVTLESDDDFVDASSLLVESVIENNTIGVDNQGNDGHGLSFNLTERTRIQDLEVVKNFFGNNGIDGFNFVRTENGSLNSVVFEDNDVTNNGSDGFDLYAENSVDDRLDFKVRRNDINSNAEYGMRINVQAAARIEVDFETNDVLGNGHTDGGTGFHPNDNAGNTGAAGGVGIFAFEEVEVFFNSVDSKISNNIGDGFSVDALDERDTLRLNANFIDTEINQNTLTGARIQGAAFATVSFVSSMFNGNQEDGVRMVSTLDPDSTFETRVGGSDIDVTAIGNQFVGNWQNGVVLGQGVSAVFGTGATTSEFANLFDGNGFTDPAVTGQAAVNTGGDGLKIVQNNGPYLHNLGRRRVIETDANFFRNNGGDGIDIGHDVNLEGGNVEHGHEVVSDTDVIINNGIISGNSGDGIEYLADGVLRVPSIQGGGQFITDPTDISSLQVSNSRIESNSGRGVDILNRVNEDSRITLINNEILTNDLSGVYVLNTNSHFQTQFGPNDPLVSSTTETMFNELVQNPASGWNVRSPNIELRVQDNNILDNGNQQSTSTVPIPQSDPDNDSTGIRDPDWTHNYRQVTGTLGGLVIRVGTVHSWGFAPAGGLEYNAADPEVELGLSGIDAEVFRNTFNGNFGASVFLDSFTSVIPPQSQGDFDDDAANHFPGVAWDQGYRDPLARLDLVFRENSGNSLDVTNGFAFYDNNEDYFKSRRPLGSSSPPHDHAHPAPTLTPGGFFTNVTRARNATRTLGFFNSVGDVPGIAYLGTGFDFSFEGHGTPTWRVESDYEFDNFGQTSTVQGFSTFEDTVDLVNTDDFFDFDAGSILSVDDRYSFQWDTGRNTSEFTGLTPYSLSRGDVFNVLPGEDPIEADGLEENDSFVGATELGVISGNGFSVNALTADSSQPGILNIERKGDRDYYRFSTAGQFLNPAGQFINVNLGVNDAVGSDLQFMIYEIVPGQDTEEVPLVALSGLPLYTTVTAGGTNFIQVAAKPDTEYVIEVLGDERTNYWDANTNTWFYYGTTRSYSLSIDAPVGSSANQAAAPQSSGDSIVTATAAGSTAAVNRPGEDPFVASLTNVGPGPINTSTDLMTVTFSEDVTGVDLTDFQLTRDGAVVDISGATLTARSFEVFEITGLAAYTAQAGAYEFSVLVADSGITDTDGVPLQPGGDDAEAWTVETNLTTLLDTIDNEPGDGIVADANGNRSLRAAINEANANTGADVIDLVAGTYLLTIEGRFEDAGLTGDLDILETVTIRGAGADQTFIDAGQIDRVFHVYPGAELILQDLTVMGGEAFDGAGVFVEGTSTFNGTSSLSGGSLTTNGVNIIDNEAFNQGGGIYNLGTVTASETSISRNVAGSRGGGVFNHGTVDLLDVTVSSNGAVSRGGGIYNEVLASQVNPIITPIRGAGSVTARNVTFAFNTANAEGGGVYQEVAASLRIGNTILDQNQALAGPEFNRGVASEGNNFIGRLVVDPVDALLVGTDIAADFTDGVVNADLEALAPGANGTLAHDLAAVSIAIDAGSNAIFTSEPIADVLDETDQVGSQRIVEANEDGVFQIDIGATEFFLSNPVAIISATPNPAGTNENIVLDGTGSTHTLTPGSSRIATYEWDFNYDGINFVVDATTDIANVSYPNVGVVTVALRVTDTDGNQDIQTLQITIDVPAAPVVTGPFAAGTSDRSPTITWTAGAGSFDLLVTNVDTSEVVISESGITDFSYTPPFDLAPGLYEVIVTATNASGTTQSQPYQFRIIEMEIVDPSNFDVEFDITPEFQFTAIPDAERYQVWVTQLDPNDRSQALAVVINDDLINAQSAALPGTNLAQYEPFIELTEGFYRVWVRAIDADGNSGAWSSGRQFTIERPGVIGPAFVTRVTLDSTPTIRWTGVGANQYQLWVTQLNGTDVNGFPLTSGQVVINTIVPGTEFTVPTPLGDGDFRVWVRAVDDDGEAGLWSRSYDFTKNLNTGPAPISPINGATTTDRTPVFEWQAVEGATRYELWVNDSSRQLVRIIHETDIPHVDGATTITYTDPDLVLRNATFAWWVRAFNEDGQATAWTDRQTFFVPAPVMTAPSGTITGTSLPTFSWTGVPEYIRYELWVNNDSTGQTRVIYEPDLPGDTLSFTPTLPLENGSFRAWVRGHDAEGNASQWSNPILFTLDASVGNAPIAFATGDINNLPFFIWEPVSSAQTYEIIVKNLLSTSQPVVLNDITAGTNVGLNLLRHDSTTPLSAGTYRWWIRGLNADGSPGPWSQPLDFNVTTNDGQPRDVDSLTNDTMLASIDTSMEGEWTDSFHSVTVHPAAVVVATIEPTEAEASFTTEPAVAPVVDEAMADLAVSRWLDLTDDNESSTDVEDVVRESIVADAAIDSAGSTTARGAAAFGIAAAISSNRRSSRKKKRSE